MRINMYTTWTPGSKEKNAPPSFIHLYFQTRQLLGFEGSKEKQKVALLKEDPFNKASTRLDGFSTEWPMALVEHETPRLEQIATNRRRTNSATADSDSTGMFSFAQRS